MIKYLWFFVIPDRVLGSLESRINAGRMHLAARGTPRPLLLGGPHACQLCPALDLPDIFQHIDELPLQDGVPVGPWLAAERRWDRPCDVAHWLRKTNILDRG